MPSAELTLAKVHPLEMQVLPDSNQFTLSLVAGSEQLVMDLANVLRPEAVSVAGGNYVHTQSAASDTWTVNHNLGFRPNATVITMGGMRMETEILHTSNNQLLILTDSATTGQVLCS